jgi:hypothetical protein
MGVGAGLLLAMTIVLAISFFGVNQAGQERLAMNGGTASLPDNVNLAKNTAFEALRPSSVSRIINSPPSYLFLMLSPIWLAFLLGASIYLVYLRKVESE